MNGLIGFLGMFSFLAVIVGLIYALCPILYLFSFGTLKWQGRELIDLQKKTLAASMQQLQLQQSLLEQTTLVAFEIQNQNKLTRQLLRAYGHEPEV